MESTLQEFLSFGVFALMLTFVRVGTALMLLPGFGESFTPTRIRLMMAMGLTVVLAPLVSVYLPEQIPTTIVLFALIAGEFITGLFMGLVARILIAALDTAGMVIALMSGLANAQVFNPGFGSQGSLPGALLTLFGVLIIFASNAHHFLIYGLIGSYEAFPVGEIPDTGGMSEVIAKMVANSFMIGIQMAAPFMVISLVIYIAMGVIARLMPQVQVFLLALPLQIMLAMVTFFLSVSTIILFWLSQFEEGMVFFLSTTAP